MAKKIKKEIKRVPKTFIALVMIVAMLYTYFVPIKNVFAQASTTSLEVTFRGDNANYGKVQYSLNDGATWNDITQNDSLTNLDVTGDNLRIKIVPNDDYIVDYAGIELDLDESHNTNLSNYGLEDSAGYSVPANVQTVVLRDVEFRADDNPGGGQPPVAFDSTAHISATIIGTEIENPYGEDASEVRFSVDNSPFMALDQNNVTYTYETVENENRVSTVTTNNPMDINYQKQSDTTVTIGIRVQWNTFLTDVTINNTSYASSLPTTKEELISKYNNQELRLYFEVPKDTNDNYNIVVEGRKQNNNEIIMGNFLWDYNEQGYTGPEDKIFHSTLQFIKAEYNNNVYDTEEELNNAGSLFRWRDAERKEVYANDGDGVGEATFPVGTMLTVAIIPDAGYQLVSFGVNEGGFAPQEQIGVYTFEIQGGNFHLQAHVTSVDNEVNAKNSDAIENGSITFNGDEQTMAIGTARLDVADIDNLSDEQVAGFKDAADSYEIQDVFDVSLFNTVYKGSRTSSWDTPVSQLDNKAIITLDMTDDLKGKEAVIIHETHDGNYEVIETSYNANNNTITFETDSFSNYAIALKDAPISSDTTNKKSNPKTNDLIYIWAGLLTISIIGLIIGKRTLKKVKK